MRRRGLLHFVGAIAVSGSLSGCQGLASPDSEERHAIDIENYSDKSQQFNVQVIDNADNALYQYDGMVSDDKLVSEVFRGEPESILVQLNEGSEEQFDWPTIDCGDTGPAPKVEVEYGATTSMDKIRIQAHCEPLTTTNT